MSLVSGSKPPGWTENGTEGEETMKTDLLTVSPSGLEIRGRAGAGETPGMREAFFKMGDPGIWSPVGRQ